MTTWFISRRSVSQRGTVKWHRPSAHFTWTSSETSWAPLQTWLFWRLSANFWLPFIPLKTPVDFTLPRGSTLLNTPWTLVSLLPKRMILRRFYFFMSVMSQMAKLTLMLQGSKMAAAQVYFRSNGCQINQKRTTLTLWVRSLQWWPSKSFWNLHVTSENHLICATSLSSNSASPPHAQHLCFICSNFQETNHIVNLLEF